MASDSFLGSGDLFSSMDCVVFLEISALWPKGSLYTLEQYTRKKSLEIHGILENLYSSTQVAVIKVVEVLNVTIIPSDVEICHELK